MDYIYTSIQQVHGQISSVAASVVGIGLSRAATKQQHRNQRKAHADALEGLLTTGHWPLTTDIPVLH